MSLGRIAAVAIMLLAAPASAGFGVPIDDDAGSGRDAADDRSNPLDLSAPGAYQGNLTPPSDSDWYELPPKNTSKGAGYAACVEGYVAGYGIANVSLTLPYDESFWATETMSADHPARLGLAVPWFNGSAVLGLEPTSETSSLGPYQMSIHVLRPGEIKEDGDAPKTPARKDVGTRKDATPGEPLEVPAACFGGLVGGDDLTDRYELNVDAGDHVVVSFAQEANMTLNLTGPNGTSGPDLHNSSDAHARHFRVNETGNLTLDAELLGTADQESPYLVGISVLKDCALACSLEDPEEEEDEDDQCRPYCFLSDVS